MLSKEQAHAIADAILASARYPRENRMASAERPIPPLYRCKELSALEPWIRTELVRQASNALNRNPLFILAALVWLLIFVLFFIYGSEGMHASKYAAPIVIVAWLLPLMIRGLLVRRSIRQVASMLGAAAVE
jgi:Flp pilus assembly protein TadB